MHPINGLLGLIFPVNCTACGDESSWLCENCFKKLPLTRFDICVICHKATVENNLCSNCQKNLGLDGVVTLYGYDLEPIRSIIKLSKYSKQHDAVRFISENNRLEAWLRLPKGRWHLAPIPLHPKKLKKRGYNQAEIIAKALSQKDHPVVNILSRVKETKDQASLSHEKREANVTGCFEVKKNIPEDVIMIDDVITTGSTLKEASIALRNAGAKRIWAITLAHG